MFTIGKKDHITADELFEILKTVKVGGNACTYTIEKCEEYVPLINEIRDLKQQKNAVILVHSYVSPEIIYGVGDFTGDSYALSKNAMNTDADTIVFSAVRFMGETAKILNPSKDVLIPSVNDGCTLADSITAEQVQGLKKQYPDYAFVCYINTTAAVKAECDVCVTSSNVYKVCENFPNDKIYFLPDKLMGQNLKNDFEKRGVQKDVKYYSGTCYVHEEYTIDQIVDIREKFPNAKVVSHPECNEEIVKASDYVGSTSQMMDYMTQTDHDQFLMLTECGLSSRLQIEFPEKQLVGSCSMCKFMKSNTLDDIARVLKNPTKRDQIEIDESVREKAQECIEAMFKYTEL